MDIFKSKEHPPREPAPLSDLQFPTSCCCERCSFYLKWPELLGGAVKQICLCIEGTGSCQIYLEKPRICCKQEHTCLCCEVRSALPCDDDVPFAIGVCGIMFYEMSPLEAKMVEASAGV